MSNPPYGGIPPAAAPWPPDRGSSRLPLILTAVVALIAIVVAIASWFRPMPEPEAQESEQQFSEQEIADAKDAVCETHTKAFRSVQNVGIKNSPDTTLTYVLGLESQLAFDAAADKLVNNLYAHPATPAELAAAVDRLASSFHDIVLARLADAPENEIDGITTEMDSAEALVKQECK